MDCAECGRGLPAAVEEHVGEGQRAVCGDCVAESPVDEEAVRRWKLRVRQAKRGETPATRDAARRRGSVA